MLAPLATSTQLRPANTSGQASSAARLAAPAPSTTTFSMSRYRPTARSMSSSVTTTMSSTSSRAIATVSAPGSTTAMPSAMVIPPVGVAVPPRAWAMPAYGVDLHPDDAHVGPPRPHRDRAAGDEPAATDRHHERVDLGCLFEDLERDRPLAGDHVWVVERGHERGTGVGREGEGVGPCIVKALTFDDHARAEHLGARHLRERRGVGHHDRGAECRATRRGAQRPARDSRPKPRPTPRARASASSWSRNQRAPRSLNEAVY